MGDLNLLIEEYEGLDGLDESAEELEAFNADFEILREDVNKVFNDNGFKVEGDSFEDYLDALSEALSDPKLSDAVADLIETRWADRGFMSKAFHRVFKTGAWKNEKTRRDTIATNRQAKLAAAQARLRKHTARVAKYGSDDSNKVRAATADTKLAAKSDDAKRIRKQGRLAGKVTRQDLINKHKQAKQAGKPVKTAKPETAKPETAAPAAPEKSAETAPEADKKTKVKIA